MTRSAYKGPPYPDPKATAGLRQRLEERPRRFLPVYRPAQVPDRPRAAK